MAVSFSALTSAYDSADASSYVTASVSPGGGPLLLGILARHTTGASNVLPSAISGNGQTWQLADSTTAGTPVVRVALWWATGASPSAGTITITLPSGILGCAWVLYELTGAHPTAPIVQTIASTDDVAATSGAVTLAAFDDAANATVGFFGWAGNEQGTVGAGFTKLPTTNPAGPSPNAAMLGEYRVDNDTVVDASWTTSGKWRAVAAEIAVAPAAGGRPPQRIVVPSVAVQHAATW